MRFFPSRVFRVCLSQVPRNKVFPNRSCRSRVRRQVLLRLTRRLRPMLPNRFPRSPNSLNRLCFRKTLLIRRTQDGRCMERPRQHFRPSLRCFLSLVCPACSLLQAFQFCLRLGRRGLQLKPIFARCLLRSQVHPQPRRFLAFHSPRFPVSPAILPMRKEHRSTLPLCPKESSPLSSVPIWPQGSLASPSVRSIRG